jgi:predicted restriction endonuclease
MCEACHIKPFYLSNNDEKYDIYNGLLMDASFHKLFDTYIISIDPLTL